MVELVNSKLFDGSINADREPFSLVKDKTTMPLARMYAIHTMAAGLFQRGVEGCVVECGVHQGASAGLLGRAAITRGHNNHLWLFDNFAHYGPMSEFDPEEGAALEANYQGSAAIVKQTMDEVGINSCDYTIVEGEFEQTLSSIKDEKIAILHINEPLYTTVKYCLETLYDQVADSGVILIDDYGQWDGCRKAVDDFLNAKSPDRIVEMKRIDDSGYYCVKGDMRCADQS